MQDYLAIANGPGMWLACSAIIVVVFFLAFRLIAISFRAGRVIGMSNKVMVGALRTGFISALVPSLAVLVGVVVLIPRLGVPFPWMRLSVIGSVIYELFAAEVAANSMGITDPSAPLTGEAFACAVWAMSLGFIFCLLFVAFFTPKMRAIRDRVAGDDTSWMEIMNSAAFFGAFGFLWGQPIARGGLHLLALVAGFAVMVVLQLLIRWMGMGWLKEWSLAVAILAGMTAVGLASHYSVMGG